MELPSAYLAVNCRYEKVGYSGKSQDSTNSRTLGYQKTYECKKKGKHTEWTEARNYYKKTCF